MVFVTINNVSINLDKVREIVIEENELVFYFDTINLFGRKACRRVTYKNKEEAKEKLSKILKA